MKTVRLKENYVVEIIPAHALPVAIWYGEEFAGQCVEAPDGVEQHWYYNGEKFISPKEAEEQKLPTEEEDTAGLLMDLEYRLCLLELGITDIT